MAPARKKIVEREKWRRTTNQRKRHTPKRPPSLPTCRHPKKKTAFLCQTLTMQEVSRFHEGFFLTSSGIDQDHFILKHTSQKVPERRRTRPGIERRSERRSQVTTFYSVGTRLRGLVRVCSKPFLSILGISKFRVQNISRKFLINGESPKERRGGDYKTAMYGPIRESLKNYLRSLRFVESHYTRERSTRQYLPSDCSASKLWNQCKYWLFMKVFNYDFNISFKSPATDACSECIRLKSQISVMQTGRAKEELMAKHTVHKLRAAAFYDLLKKEEDPTILKLSFDCQKNQVLPRVPDQAAYYSRQLYVYNFTICEGHSTTLQNTKTVFIYTWLEHERTKGSNEISSIVYHHLKNKDLGMIVEIKLFCDGCPGQNKNITMIGMLAKFLSEVPSLRKISVTYPVVGHSFLPADRVFGRIEKKTTIIDPQQYFDLFSQFGTVRRIGEDVQISDWKTAVASVVKLPAQLHFKFAPSKRLTLEKTGQARIFLKGDSVYRSDVGELRPFLKKGKALRQIVPHPLPMQVSVKSENLRDVNHLLTQHFGADWRTMEVLNFYAGVIDGTSLNNDPNAGDDEGEAENIEEDDGLRI